MGAAKQSKSKATLVQLLVHHGFDLARALGVKKVLVHANRPQDVRVVQAARESEQILWLATDAETVPVEEGSDNIVIQMPVGSLTGMNMVDMGCFLAALNGHLEVDETALCLFPLASTGRISGLVVTHSQKRNYSLPKLGTERIQRLLSPETFVALVDIALRFAAEGREGKPIGTTFVLGPPEQLAPHIRQLILNPCKGHLRKDRNIHNRDFFETLRELGALDGAFIIRSNGVVESAGTYLGAPRKGGRLRSGLGARHAAAAMITASTAAVAVVLSESSGNVTVFRGGRTILELEKPKG
jgi:diadenylate cyclase